MFPNHVLILGSPRTGKLRVVKFLISDTISDLGADPSSHSGLIVRSNFATKYYNISLNYFIDEYPPERSLYEKSKHQEFLYVWLQEFASDSMHELREVLDGIIFTISMDEPLSQIENSLSTLSGIANVLGIEDSKWDGFFTVVGVTNENDIEKSKIEDIEDLAITTGFEFINFHDCGKNEYYESLGKDRLREVLETHDWKSMDIRDNENYEADKLKRLDSLSEGLLNIDHNEDEQKKDLGELFQRIKSAKENVGQLHSTKKEEYTKKVIEDLLNFI